jgi:hypothetical protein
MVEKVVCMCERERERERGREGVIERKKKGHNSEKYLQNYKSGGLSRDPPVFLLSVFTTELYFYFNSMICFLLQKLKLSTFRL